MAARNTATVVKTQPRGCRWLEMAARACPGAAAASKWLLELAPEPQNARKVLLKPGPEPQNAREVVLEPQNAPKMPLEPAPDPQNARRVSLELAPEPQQARKVPLEPTAVRCVRFLRSKSTVFCSSVIGLHFCSAPLCSVALGLAGAFDLAARALSASLRDPGKPSLPGDASQGGAADACCTPSPFGLAGVLELAARARSASLGRSKLAARARFESLTTRPGYSKTPHMPRFPTSTPWGLAGAPELAARARSASLGRSTWLLDAWLRWGARN